MSKRIEPSAKTDTPRLCTHAMQGAALLATALMLGACGKTPSSPPVPTVATPRLETSPAQAGTSDPSVPDADSVITPSAVPKVDPAAGRTNAAMTRGQESGAMPLPGQNNDHSAPVGPAKRASSP